MHELHTLKRPSKKQVCPELRSIEIYSFPHILSLQELDIFPGKR